MRALSLFAIVVGAAACGAFGGSDTVPPGGDAADGGDAAAGDGAAGPGISGPAKDLATHQQTPTGIVVDSTSVYWLSEASSGKAGSILKVAKGGGMPAVLASNLAGPNSLAASATTLYFTDNDPNGGSYQRLHRQDKGGGGISADIVQVNANDHVFGCSVQGTSVFFALQKNGSVSYLDTTAWTANSVVPVAIALGMVGLVVADSTHAWVGVTGQIKLVRRSDMTTTVFATVTGTVRALVIDEASQTVFWADDSSVSALGKSSPGAAPLVFASSEQAPSAIAIDATTVYWANTGDGSIRSAPRGGGAPTTLASGESEPRGIAVDDSALYWTNYGDGRVRVIRR